MVIKHQVTFLKCLPHRFIALTERGSDPKIQQKCKKETIKKCKIPLNVHTLQEDV